MNKFTLTLLLFLYSIGASASLSKPDFSTIENVEERKQAFFDYIYPALVNSSKKVLAERKLILAKGPTRHLCEKYRVTCSSDSARDKLLAKVNIVLPSQVLAQAAIESAWGRSRFAKKANNYFGVWCWTPGCGLVPLKRPEGEQYWVKSYDSIESSMDDFLLNLNRHKAYSDFRNARQRSLNSVEWVKHLTAYSQEEHIYTDKIRKTILSNNLQELDDEFLNELDIRTDNSGILASL